MKNLNITKKKFGLISQNLYCTAKPQTMMRENLILFSFSHGAGGREDNKKQLLDAGGLESFEKNKLRTKHQSHICRTGSTRKKMGKCFLVHIYKMPKISDSMQMAFEALDAYIQDPKNQVDSKRIYVMGLSMGGYGTWDAIQKKARLFCCCSPYLWRRR